MKGKEGATGLDLCIFVYHQYFHYGNKFLFAGFMHFKKTEYIVQEGSWLELNLTFKEKLNVDFKVHLHCNDSSADGT